MKVFISWSGDSKGVAQAISSALPRLFDDAKPWISTENRSGSIWIAEIDKQLSDTDFGIICLTKSNQHAPWINFEAGALSRRVESKRELMPILLMDFDEMSDVDSPVAGFHMQMATEDGFFNVMKDLNSCELGPKIPEEILKDRVSGVWPAIAEEVEKIKQHATSTDVVERSLDDKVDELLDTVRGIASSVARGSGSGADLTWDTALRAYHFLAGDEGPRSNPRSMFLAEKTADAINEWAKVKSLFPDEVYATASKPGRIVVETRHLDEDRRKMLFVLAVDAANDSIEVVTRDIQEDGTAKVMTWSKKKG